MPSQAYGEYDKNLKDVNRLVGAHKNASHTKPGKRGLGHFTRGGLLLLCAAWERYVESVLEESAEFLTTRLPYVTSLPAAVEKKVRDHANSGKTVWAAADVTTQTWKQIYLEVVFKRTNGLNTPKHENLKPMFADTLNISDIETAWTCGRTSIDKFVSLRGEVAHRGGQSTYIRFGQLTEAKSFVTKYVVETDNYLSDHVRGLVTPNWRPWNRIGAS